MNNITIEDLLKVVESYDSKNLSTLKKAYDFADVLHSGQKRQSG